MTTLANAMTYAAAILAVLASVAYAALVALRAIERTRCKAASCERCAFAVRRHV